MGDNRSVSSSRFFGDLSSRATSFTIYLLYSLVTEELPPGESLKQHPARNVLQEQNPDVALRGTFPLVLGSRTWPGFPSWRPSRSVAAPCTTATVREPMRHCRGPLTTDGPSTWQGEKRQGNVSHAVTLLQYSTGYGSLINGSLKCDISAISSTVVRTVTK